jgi:adenylate kinase
MALKKIILIGPPGSGKGTQSAKIAAQFEIPSISTGYILREAVRLNSPLGQTIKKTIESGSLVADDCMIELIRDRLSQDDCRNGFILDGFPRTLAQAKALMESQIIINYVFYLTISDDIIIERLSGRREHPLSGRTYHILYNPPAIEGVDDQTGDFLIQRADDQPENIKTRLKSFHELTRPVIEYYETTGKNFGIQVETLDAHQNIDLLTQKIFHVLHENK